MTVVILTAAVSVIISWHLNNIRQSLLRIERALNIRDHRGEFQDEAKWGRR